MHPLADDPEFHEAVGKIGVGLTFLFTALIGAGLYWMFS